MNLSTISLELQQVFAIVYAALVFWALVFMLTGAIVLALYRAASTLLARRNLQ
jgi:hypothetical protein